MDWFWWFWLNSISTLSEIICIFYFPCTFNFTLFTFKYFCNISAKASRIFNFVRRNVYVCSAQDVHQLERVQRRPACFVMNNYRTTSVASLLKELEWSPLSVRRRNSRLVAVYKVVYNLSPVPVGKLRPCSHQTRSYDPLTVTFTPFAPRTNYYKYSFSPRIVVDWNSLLFSLRAKLSVESFRAGLQHFIISTSSHWTEPQHSSRNGPRPYSTELPKYGSTTPKECRYLLNYLVKSKGKHQETKR